MQKDTQLEELKLFSQTVQQLGAQEPQADVPADERYAHEARLNTMLDQAMNLHLKYPKEVYELMTEHMPNYPMPRAIQAKYDGLSDEKKASKANALQAAADAEARGANLHAILFSVVEKMDKKHPEASKISGVSPQEQQGAFYVEIVRAFEENDFPEAVRTGPLPTLEDALTLTKFIDRHNDPAQRAELHDLASAYEVKANQAGKEAAPIDGVQNEEVTNTIENVPAKVGEHERLESLIEQVEPLAKHGQVLTIPGRKNAVVYVDEESSAIKIAALSSRVAKSIAKAFEAEAIDVNGAELTVRSQDALPQLGAALAKLKVSEKGITGIESTIKEITKPALEDASDEVILRARQLRQARLLQMAKQALEQEQSHTADLKDSPPPPAASGEQQIEDDDLLKHNAPRIIPAEVQRSYLRVEDKRGDRFYHNGRFDSVAFIDKGTKLETKTDNEHTAMDMVRIADARGWDSIKVSGAENFRRQVWLEGTARGIVVRGYKPNDIDKALVAQRAEQLGKQSQNTIEQIQSRDKDEKQADEVRKPTELRKTAHARTVDATSEKAQTGPASSNKTHDTGDLSGTLLEHGAAPFEFNDDNKKNYYVKLRTDSGKERIIWGLDLERAVTQAEAKPGDQITLENQGKKPVEVTEKVKDDNGNVVGTKRITTHRNSWNVEVARDFLKLPAKEFAEKHPDQVNAAIIKAVTEKALAEHSKFDALSPADKKRLQAGVEHRVAQAISEGKPLPSVKVASRTRRAEPLVEAELTPGRDR